MWRRNSVSASRSISARNAGCDSNDFASDANSTVDMAALKARRLVTGTFDHLRILGDGADALTKPLTVRADHFSKSAKAAIEKAGGTCDAIPKPKRPVRNKMGSKKKAQVAAAAAKAAKKA